MIAITGANGLLGSYIVRELLAKQVPFVALKRSNSDLSLLHDVASAVTWRDADVTDYNSLLEAFEGVTGVIHAAAMVSYHKRDKNKIFKINVEGTSNVVNACLQAGVKRLMHISSVAALGKAKGQQLVTEESKWVEGTVSSNYAVSKYRAEVEVWRGQEEGLSTVIVNPSVILAPTDWNKSSAQLFKYAWQERPFYTRGGFSIVDVRDAALCVLKLFQSTIEAERFILAAGTISYFDFFTKTAMAFAKKGPSIRIGKSLLQIAAAFEGARALLLRSTPLVTKETAQLAGKTLTYSNEKIKKSLGVDFQPIESTIQWCCAEYMKKLADKK